MPPFVDITDVRLTYGGGRFGHARAGACDASIDERRVRRRRRPVGLRKVDPAEARLGPAILPTHGGVIVADREVAAPLSIVGMAFQNPIMLPWRTTLDNVLLPLEIVEPHASRFRRERAGTSEKARELLAVVGLDGFADHYPWQLSGGMQQRASLCRSLIHEPELLLLDEPFGALDAFTREELWVVLQDAVAAAQVHRRFWSPTI